jgi:hypothetical protein
MTGPWDLMPGLPAEYGLEPQRFRLVPGSGRTILDALDLSVERIRNIWADAANLVHPTLESVAFISQFSPSPNPRGTND